MDAQETAQGVSMTEVDRWFQAQTQRLEPGWHLRYHNGRKVIERVFIELESLLDFTTAMNLTDRIEIQRVKA